MHDEVLQDSSWSYHHEPQQYVAKYFFQHCEQQHHLTSEQPIDAAIHQNLQHGATQANQPQPAQQVPQLQQQVQPASPVPQAQHGAIQNVHYHWHAFATQSNVQFDYPVPTQTQKSMQQAQPDVPKQTQHMRYLSFLRAKHRQNE
ncbi:MAG: hypothetical protein E7011_03195 [Alphaproteobacteria bacterium]|nr:hypothetical protein [Alphaproteobacteria bacterium]